MTVAVITHDRHDEVCRTLGKLTALSERIELTVVDNASRDGTAEIVRREGGGDGPDRGGAGRVSGPIVAELESSPLFSPPI